MSSPAGVDSPRGATASTRNATLDGLKYVAASGIVLHHVASGAGTQLGAFLSAAPLWSLFFFFAVSGYFHGELGTRGFAWLKKRVIRLGIPYVVWSAFYFGYRNLGVLTGGERFAPPLLDTVLLAGAHGILWSLALLIYIAIAVELAVKSVALRRIALALTAAVTLGMYWLAPFDVIQVHPYANFMLVSRYAFAYLAGMEIRQWGESRVFPAWTLYATAVGSIVGVGLMRLGPLQLPLAARATVETLLWTLAALVILRGAATGLTWYGAARLAWARDYLVGIYVVHVLWLSWYIALVPVSSLSDWAWIAAGWVFCFGSSTLIVAILRSNRITRVAVN